ncbi:hypothetical protein ACHHRT_01135 [Desulfurivibrio sp. D14AmB]|uniref:hypothetical protein n=1 Tax=Desulfurivibrio sp. D14AmB TaxID=3374370 RepID=UPI00376F42EA
MASKDTLPLLEGPDRVHYATGVLLGAEDFQAEQDYHRGRLARALAYAMGYGTLAGLAVEHQPAQPAAGDDPARPERLVVQPGLAIDRLGRLLEVNRPRCLDLDQWYRAQSPQLLRQAWHDADSLWSGAPAGVAADLFVRFEVCGRGKTPAFAGTAFDSFDSVTAARLRDGFAVELLLRQESNPGLPQPQWPDFAESPASLRDAIYNAWREGTAHSLLAELAPLAEHLPGQDASSVFLARLLLPADQGPIGQRPLRRLTETVPVRNDWRPFVVTANALARWLGIGVTADR